MSKSIDEESELETARISSFLSLLSRNQKTALEIGARAGKITRLLPEYFESITALDLTMPPFSIDHVTCVVGDVTALTFQDNSFDCVICTEVLEHVPQLQQGCDELSRVTKNELIVGVPFEQDLRLGRLTCNSCGKPTPAWSHVNTFSKSRLIELFPRLKLKKVSFTGEKRGRTNWLTCWLFDLAKNPWGDYSQQEPCIHCGSRLTTLASRSLIERICSKIGMILFRIQDKITKTSPIWIHAVFVKIHEKNE